MSYITVGIVNDGVVVLERLFVTPVVIEYVTEGIEWS